MHRFLLFALALVLALPTSAQQLNEIRPDYARDADRSLNEYVELAGTPGASLDGLTLLILSRVSAAQGGEGYVRTALSLGGQTIPSDGLFLIARFANDFPGEVDLASTSLFFGVRETNTFLLVSGFTGDRRDDLDTDDDGTLDVIPWNTIADGVARVSGEPDEFEYATQLNLPALGPATLDGEDEAPSLLYRTSNTRVWTIGDFFGADNTPGAPNPEGESSPQNQDPVSDDVADGASFDVDPGETLSQTFSFSDPDAGDVVSVDVEDPPTNFSVSANSSVGNPTTLSITFAPTAAQANQSYAVTYTARDGNGGSTAVTVTYNVGGMEMETCDYEFSAFSRGATSVPSSGGFLRFGFEIDNTNGDSAAEPGIFGILRDDSGAITFVRNRSARNRTPLVPAGAVYRAGYNQRIPAEFADGTYTYTIYAGELDADDPDASTFCGSETFTVTKGGANATASGASGAASKNGGVALPEGEIVGGELLKAAEVRVGPNPTAGRATFAFSLGQGAEVRLAVYDALGREVAVLADGTLAEGAHQRTLAGEGLAPGVYVWRLETGKRVQSGSLVLVR